MKVDDLLGQVEFRQLCALSDFKWNRRNQVHTEKQSLKLGPKLW